MNELRNRINEIKAEKGIGLDIEANGQPDGISLARSLAEFAQVSFSEDDDGFCAFLEDDSNRVVKLISVDQLDNLIADQTFNRGDWFDSKDDLIKHLSELLERGDVGQERFDSITDDLKSA